MISRATLLVVGIAACGDNAHAFRYETIVVDPAFRAEGVAVFDVDRDGVADIVTDQFWYAGPSFAPTEIRAPEIYDPQGYAHSVSMWGDDLDRDGFTDLVVAPFPTDAMYWFANPQGREGHWTPHEIAPPLFAGTEQPVYADLFGDGRRELVMGIDATQTLAWFAPGADPTIPWERHSISESGFAGASRFSHGVGTGDVDNDGRTDVLTTMGWFQQTVDHDIWTFHEFPTTADPCSTMFAIDLDGDGRADIVCAHPHTYGIDWWNQQFDGTFLARSIDATISQMGAVALADLDGDGVEELVSGKNWLAHPAGDPGTDDPKIVVAYSHLDGEFERHVIDEDSGIGRQITVADIDADRLVDLVTSTKRGLFVFHHRR